jgi:hypothetical protein
MRPFDELLSRSREGKAFSNNTDWERWSWRFCERCRNDVNEDCPLILISMFHDLTPAEWVEDGEHHNYDCTEFEPREEES